MVFCTFMPCRDWRRCKYWLLSLFKLMVANMSVGKGGQSREEKVSSVLESIVGTATLQLPDQCDDIGLEGRLYFAPTHPQTLVQNVLDVVDEKSAPNYALLLLWASQANAIPVSTNYALLLLWASQANAIPESTAA